MSYVAVDTNLLLLLVVGRVDRAFIPRHKRLKTFSAGDYDLLWAYVQNADGVVATPNSLTETANLLVQGVREPLLRALQTMFEEMVLSMNETYLASKLAVACQEFKRLGLTDAAWLECLDNGTRLLTADLDLFLAAKARGKVATNFSHLREEHGLL